MSSVTVVAADCRLPMRRNTHASWAKCCYGPQPEARGACKGWRQRWPYESSKLLARSAGNT
eukprot:10442660-Alexandrium_andersonii.AAC.1